MVQTTVDPIVEANRRAKEVIGTQREDEKLAKQEMKARKAADIKNIPPIPTCPGLSKIGGQIFCDITKGDGVSKATAVWGWWRKIASEYPERLTTYVTRLHPAMLPKPKGQRSETTIHGFPEWEHADDYGNLESWVLQRFGSGNYRFYVNDTALGALLVNWTINGIWDLEKFPPVVSPEEVDTGSPNNAAFVDFLRRKNILKDYEDKPVAEQPNPAAAVAAATQAAQVAQQPLTAAINTIASMAKESRASQPDPSAIAENISKSYAKVVDVAMDSMQRMRELEVKGKDPGDYIDQLVKVSKLISPPPVDIAGVMKEARESAAAAAKGAEELARELRERDREERNALRSEIRELKQRPPEDPLASLEKTFALVERFKGIGGGGSDDEDSKGGGKEPWWADMAKAILPAIAPVIGLGAQFLATKLAPAQQQQMVQQPQQPGIVPINPNPQQPQPQQDPMNIQEMMLWNTIGAQMQNHFVTGKSGHEFAEWFVDKIGKDNYLAIAQQYTRDQVVASMKHYAPSVAANVLLPDGTPHGQFLKFMDEFLDHQAVLNEGESEPEPQIIDAEPVTPLRRVRQAR